MFRRRRPVADPAFSSRSEEAEIIPTSVRRVSNPAAKVSFRTQASHSTTARSISASLKEELTENPHTYFSE